MKKSFILVLFSLISLNVLAQKAKWAELDDYHTTMAMTFHPAEEGNLKPLLEQSGELAKKAKMLKKSAIPADYQKEGVKTSIELLAKESVSLDKMVKAQKPEAELKKAIFALHDRFHEVMEKCNH